MAGMSIDKLKKILLGRQTPPDVVPPVVAMRKSMEKMAFKAADDAAREHVGAAEWIEVI